MVSLANASAALQRSLMAVLSVLYDSARSRAEEHCDVDHLEEGEIVQHQKHTMLDAWSLKAMPLAFIIL